jgi:hypothetical protein
MTIFPLTSTAPAAIVTTDLASLTPQQLDAIVEGIIVTTSTTGERWQYTGTGDKTLTASYVLISDVTPDWSTLTSVPATFPPTTHAIASHSGLGTVDQYLRGDGSLAEFPLSAGGGSSVSYYLNASVSQGTLDGEPHLQISRTPVIGSGTPVALDSTTTTAYFITDAGDPALISVPQGNWVFTLYASTTGGSPTLEAELYKYDGSAFTAIGTATPAVTVTSASPTITLLTLSVPATTLAATDRLAIRLIADNLSGQTLTVSTEGTRLAQALTTFSTGMAALNGLSAQVQQFATGTAGNDFTITSSGSTHTFDLPTASASASGKLSSTDWSTFNAKVDTADSRLSDARTPTSHTHATSDITSGTLDIARLPVGTTTGTVAAGDDARLTDARTPTAHKTTHATGGTDALTPADIGAAPATGIDPTAITGTAVIDSDARLSDARTPTSHTHGNLTDDGKLGTTAGLPVVTTTDGAVTTLALGTAGQALVVNSGANGLEFATAGGVTSGSTDNAILRADGTGGSTSQGSDIIIDDATTSTQNNVAITQRNTPKPTPRSSSRRKARGRSSSGRSRMGRRLAGMRGGRECC